MSANTIIYFHETWDAKNGRKMRRKWKGEDELDEKKKGECNIRVATNLKSEKVNMKWKQGEKVDDITQLEENARLLTLKGSGTLYLVFTRVLRTATGTVAGHRKYLTTGPLTSSSSSSSCFFFFSTSSFGCCCSSPSPFSSWLTSCFFSWSCFGSFALDSSLQEERNRWMNK